ncbi:MAG TPA: CAP domain-containing protein [Blastocatellia bacterium]|nr:CAP domain-containing protein [Blastocatellia bacterium]
MAGPRFENTPVSRRLFLRSAAHCIGASLAAQISKRAVASVPQLSKSDVEQFRAELLHMVNRERKAHGVSSLALDDLACAVAAQHAHDMATGGFLSHWGSDGRKPYHRYSLAGGFDSVAENVSAVRNLEALDAKYVGLVLAQAHQRMHDETPPDDGHRQTILAPQHTHVGFGMALSGRDLRLVELYVAKYVRIDPYQVRAKRRSSMQVSGKVLDRKYALYYVEVFYEPLPLPPVKGWLNEPRPYGLPDDYVVLRPKLPPGTLYADGVKGTIEVGQDGRFHIPVSLNREDAGIYTVVVWISRKGSRGAFQATNACILAE